MDLQIERVPCPIGEILLLFEGENLRVLDFSDYEDRMHRLLKLHYGKVNLTPGHTPIRKQIDAYFEGDLKAITRIPVQTAGTKFQREVWKALITIEPGQTRTYGQIAATIERPKAVRAVGAANGANPVGIVVPCHRVIGADGSLTGYGGGMERKKWLLAHELKASTSNRP